jgi:hypothetical protein
MRCTILALAETIVFYACLSYSLKYGLYANKLTD